MSDGDFHGFLLPLYRAQGQARARHARALTELAAAADGLVSVTELVERFERFRPQKREAQND